MALDHTRPPAPFDEEVQVGAAHAAVADLEQQLAGLGPGRRPVLDRDLELAHEDRRRHDVGNRGSSAGFAHARQARPNLTRASTQPSDSGVPRAFGLVARWSGCRACWTGNPGDRTSGGLMAADIVIRGGSLVDGTGAPARRADIAISDGVVSDIGDGLDGQRVLEAGGNVVAPGFIDIHTHYDAQVFWDPALTPSCWHGVTSVVAGNCGFSIAPGPARAPRAARPHAPARRGHGARHVVRGRALGRLRDLPAVLRRDRAARHAAQLRVLRRSHRGPHLRDGRSRIREGSHRRRRAQHAARDRGSDGRGRGGIRDLGVTDAQRRPRSTGAVAHRRPRRSVRARAAAARRAQGRGRAPPRREGHARRRVRRAARRRPPGHVDRAAHGARATRGTRRSWPPTSRRAPRASRCGRRCRAGRSRSR